MLKRQKGITLVSLVITIIVLLILLGISVGIVTGGNNVIDIAKNAKKESAIASKNQEVLGAVNKALSKNDGDIEEVTVSRVINTIKKNYPTTEQKNSISSETLGTGEDKFPAQIIYAPPSSGISETIVITVDGKLTIASSETIEPEKPIPKVEIGQAKYNKVGHIYCNSPDLSGFNPESTYYVVYDENGNNEQIYGRIDRVEPPENWYDYENKIWANIVTVNGSEVAYWTWIPRYKYKTKADDASIPAETVDLKYVDINDTCTMNIDGVDTTVDVSGYKLSEAFMFDTTKLYGYWMSKYEVQDATNLEIVYGYSNKKSITVTTTAPDGEYTVFVDGVKNTETPVSLPYTITGLKEGREYDICVVSEKNKRMAGRTQLTAFDIEVDGSGFNTDHTYYVVYDQDGTNERIAGKIQLDGNGNIIPPSEGVWLDPSKKIWANIVTVNVSDVTYWTYIPRYEYRMYSPQEMADVRYIPVSKTTPSIGCKISEAFKFDNQDLKGYYLSKYEVQEATTSTITGQIIDDNHIQVSSASASGTYTIILNGNVYQSGVSLPYSVEVESINNYNIIVISDTTNTIVGNVMNDAEI